MRRLRKYQKLKKIIILAIVSKRHQEKEEGCSIDEETKTTKQ